jgi:hypothetical protein
VVDFTKHPKQKKPTIQIHPRALKEEKQCCDCTFFIENVDGANTLGYCSELKEPTLKYDECGAFTKSTD